MLKIFIRLWLLVFLPLIFLLFSTTYNPINAINKSVLHDRVKETYKGTFYLLEERLEALPEDQWAKQFETMARMFGHELKLIPLETTIEGQPPLSELSIGEFLIFSDSYDSDVIVKRLFDTDWYIYMMLEASEDQETLAQAQGTLNLLLERFANTPRALWSSKIDDLSGSFGFPLSLISIADLDVPDTKKNQLESIGKTWLTDENNETMVYQALADSDLILQAGPIPLPGNELSVLAAIMSVFIAGVSLGILVFVLPLWKDLKKLTHTASQFGGGHLAQRSDISKRSVVSGLSSSFNTMADQIERMIKGQRELTNAIAHDLRTPLSRLSFAFEMLDSEEALTPQEKERYKRSIASGIDTLDHLIQQILTLSRYSRAADVTQFTSQVLARELSSEVRQLEAENQHLKFHLDIDPVLVSENVFADHRSIMRALNNLVSNAIRYANSTVRIGFMTKEGDYLLSVEDDGPGIPPDQRRSVLLPFKQLDNAQRGASKEHGLGLAIVKQIAQWHNGTIDITDSMLGGAHIEVRWKIARS